MKHTKTCLKCHKTKGLLAFYKQAEMKGGRLNKCKKCTKRDTRQNYRQNRIRRAEYERVRATTPKRKRQVLKYQRKRRRLYPQKNRARIAINNAIQRGKITRQSCSICGEPDAQAHHDDYSKPFRIEWLCFKHHRTTKHHQRIND